MKCFACEKQEIFEENGKLVQIYGQHGYAICIWDSLDKEAAETWDADWEMAIDFCPYCGRDLTTKN